ncbi:MAG: hypothetical protein E7162_01895 [Firmicutes bacterium]|nr:hypothetical protein [Bacillota bacterium]
MKKMAKLFLVFLLAVSLTGCVKYNVSMEVKDDKSVTLEVIYGMEISEDMFGNVEEDGTTVGENEDDNYWSDEDDSWSDDEEESDEVTTEDYKHLEELGYKVEEFKETKDGSTISGVKITKTFDNIDDITGSSKEAVNFNELFAKENVEKLKDVKFFYKDGKNYVANFEIDFLNGASEEERKESESYDSMITDLSYKIKLPVKAGENNASKVSEDGKELTWNLKYSKLNKINFSFALGNNLLLIIAVVAGVAVVGGVVAVVVVSKKKKNTNGMNAAPVMPEVQPMANPEPVNNVPPMENASVTDNAQPVETAPVVEESQPVEATPVAEEVQPVEAAPVAEEVQNNNVPTDNV